jgi:hypothetical protein
MGEVCPVVPKGKQTTAEAVKKLKNGHIKPLTKSKKAKKDLNYYTFRK